jgi:ABC-2 type transport system permease protein
VLDWMMWALTCFFPAPMRLLMVKDLRLFRRDPMQWSQFLIFFGLLTLYFFNVRRFNYDLYYIGWVNMVSFLNVSVVGLLMSTFTTRFIYPLLSLEGQRFWLLGLLPVRRQMILWSKFLFAAGTAIVPCSLLTLLSDLMLDISLMVMVSHQLTCLILCFGLAGIAVGLGARLPNLREPSPSRIAAGFGGTLCLVISTLYILTVVLLTALPTHFVIAAKSTTTGPAMLESDGQLVYWLNLWLLGGTAASIGLGILATVVPLRMGFRYFKRMEF